MRSKILLIGSVPPPYHGVNVINKTILDSELTTKFRIIHFDISDPRSIKYLGRLDIRNIWLAIMHILRLIRILIQEKPHVVYLPICQTAIGYFRDTIFIALSKLFKAFVIIHLHGSYFRIFYEKANSIVRYIIRSSLGRVDRAIVLGKSVRHIFAGLLPDRRIVVIPNGIEDEFAGEQNRSKKSNNQHMVLYLSNLKRAKGFLDVVHCIPDIVQHYKNTKFVFAGEPVIDDHDHSEVVKFITEHGISEHVVQTGVVVGQEKRRLLLSTDVLVFPSYNEGQPLVILEAMSAGLPIITTNTGTIAEMVIDGKNGFIVEKGNVQQITDRILKLIDNKPLRMRMGRAGRNFFLARHTRDKFIGNLCMIFDEVLHNRFHG